MTDCEPRILSQDCLLELSQHRRWLDSERFDKCLSRDPVDLERLRLATGSVQRAHQSPTQAFTEWMDAHEYFELRDELRVTSDGEIRFDPQLESGEMDFLQPSNFRLKAGNVHEVGQRLPAPQLERFTQQPTGPFRIDSYRLGNEALETQQVELIGVNLDEISRVLGQDQFCVAE